MIFNEPWHITIGETGFGVGPIRALLPTRIRLREAQEVGFRALLAPKDIHGLRRLCLTRILLRADSLTGKQNRGGLSSGNVTNSRVTSRKLRILFQSTPTSCENISQTTTCEHFTTAKLAA